MKAAFPQPAYRLQCLKSVLFCSLLLFFGSFPIAQLGQGKLLLFSDFALSFEHVTVSIVQQDLQKIILRTFSAPSHRSHLSPDSMLHVFPIFHGKYDLSVSCLDSRPRDRA
jgi:hypothetical protein